MSKFKPLGADFYEGDSSESDELGKGEKRLMDQMTGTIDYEGAVANKTYMIETVTTTLTPEQQKRAEYEKQVVLASANYERNRAVMEGVTDPAELDRRFEQGLRAGVAQLAADSVRPALSHGTSTRGNFTQSFSDMSHLVGDRDLREGDYVFID